MCVYSRCSRHRCCPASTKSFVRSVRAVEACVGTTEAGAKGHSPESGAPASFTVLSSVRDGLTRLSCSPAPPPRHRSRSVFPMRALRLRRGFCESRPIFGQRKMPREWHSFPAVSIRPTNSTLTRRPTSTRPVNFISPSCLSTGISAFGRLPPFRHGVLCKLSVRSKRKSFVLCVCSVKNVQKCCSSIFLRKPSNRSATNGAMASEPKADR